MQGGNFHIKTKNAEAKISGPLDLYHLTEAQEHLAKIKTIDLSFLADTGSFIIWMVILKRSNLSVAMPISSICYITILLTSWLGFHEIITIKQLLGIFFIMSGIALISHDESREIKVVE